jgi:hypothetical protein
MIGQKLPKSQKKCVSIHTPHPQHDVENLTAVPFNPLVFRETVIAVFAEVEGQ